MKVYTIETENDGLVNVVSSRAKAAQAAAKQSGLAPEEVKRLMKEAFKKSTFVYIHTGSQMADITEWEVE